MLVCSECGKTIANTNPRVHYGICATCSIPVITGDRDTDCLLAIEKRNQEFNSETEEQMNNEKSNHDLHLRDQTAKSMIAWLVEWKYIEITNVGLRKASEDGVCIIPSDLLKTGKAFKRESLLMGTDDEKTNT